MHRVLVGTSLFLTVFALTACGGGGDGGSPTEPEPEPEVITIEVTPSSAEVDAIGVEQRFSATALDQDGNSMTGITFFWSASPGSVASVDSAGTATAEGEGAATIEATASGVTGTAQFTVDQVPVSASVQPSEVTVTADGDTAHLEAEASDANDHVIEDAGFDWSSSDMDVATVDETGVVTGQSTGTVRIEARAQEGTDPPAAGSSVTVEEAGPQPAPTVTSVEPMTELESVTIQGRDFALDPGGNTVTVDGVEADVTSASEDELVVDVPQLGCVPDHEASVEVSTSGGSDSTSGSVTPDEEPVRMDVGEQIVRSAPEEFCFQFAETSTEERYLVGVQSLSSVVSSLTPVRVTAEAAGGGGAASVSPRTMAGEETAGGRGFGPDRSRLRKKHRAAEFRLRAWERRHLEPGASLPVSSSGQDPRLASSVPDSVQVGDTVSLRVPNTRMDNACINYLTIGGVVKVIGARGIFVADTANPENGFTDADYQDFSDRMDAEVFSVLVDYFGSPTDMDDNDRVVVVISKAVNESSDALGFVFGGDLFPRSTSDESFSCASSDEGELYYGRAPDPNGQFGDAYATDQARLETPFVMSHELTHVIQLSRRFATDQPFMSSRVSEAQATLGEEVVGHAVTGRSTGQNYGAAIMFNANDTDEIDWYTNGFNDLATYFGFESETSRVEEAPDACGWWREEPEPCLGRAKWYGVGWTFLRWISDHFGPSVGGEKTLHRRIIGRGGQGLSNVAAIVGEPVERLMARWSAMLYLDDRNAASTGLLRWPSWDLFDYEENTVETAHLEPFEEAFRDWQAVGEIRASSAGYITIEGSDRPATAVRFEGQSGGLLPSSTQVWVVRTR